MAAPMPEPAYVRAADLVILFYNYYGRDGLCHITRYAIRATRTAFPYKELFTWGPWRGLSTESTVSGFQVSYVTKSSGIVGYKLLLIAPSILLPYSSPFPGARVWPLPICSTWTPRHHHNVTFYRHIFSFVMHNKFQISIQLKLLFPTTKVRDSGKSGSKHRAV